MLLLRTRRARGARRARREKKAKNTQKEIREQIVHTTYIHTYINTHIHLSELAGRWPLNFSLEHGRIKPLWLLKMQGACRQGLLFQAAQGQF